MPIAWEDDHVQSIVRKVKKVVDSNEIGPKRYIFDVYGHYEPLLQEPFSDSFDANPGEMTWRQNEDVQYLVTLNPTSQLLDCVLSHSCSSGASENLTASRKI